MFSKRFLIYAVFISSIAFAFLFCTEPLNPRQMDENATISIDASAFTVHVGDTAYFEISVYLTDLIHSVQIDYGDGSRDTVEISSNDTLISMKHIYAEEGEMRVTATAYTNTVSKTSTLRIDIVQPVELVEKDISASAIPEKDSPLTLTISAQGTAPISYSWYRDGELLPESDHPKYVFESLQEDDTGSYYCIVQNDYGSDTSLSHTLKIKEQAPPDILNEKGILTSGVVKEDSSFTLSIEILSDPTCTFQWFKNDTLIEGENSGTLSFAALEQMDAGDYYCVVENAVGEAISDTYTLEFGNNTYEIALKTGANGSISPAAENDTIEVTEGNDLRCVFSPDEGYRVSEVLIDGEPNGSAVENSRYTFTGVADNHSIEVTYEIMMYKVNVSKTGSGSISADVSLSDSIPYGTELSLEAIPEEGFYFEEWAGETAGADNPLLLTVEKNLDLIARFASVGINTTDDTVAVLQGEQRKIDVLKNDAISFGELKITGYSDASFGTVSINDSTMTYTADDSAVGVDTLIYYVNDGQDSGTVYITILPIEIIATNDSISIKEDAAPVEIDVLQNDSITSGEMTLSEIIPGRLGTTEIVDNKVRYAPKSDLNGIDTIRYYINDAKECSLFVTIIPVNDLPEFTQIFDKVTLREGESKSLTFRAMDIDGDSVFFSLADTTHWMDANQKGDSIQIELAPEHSVVATGSDSAVFTIMVYAVSRMDTILQEVDVTVYNVNRTPVFDDHPDTIYINEEDTEILRISASDGDSETVEIDVLRKPDWVSVGGSVGEVELTISPDYEVATSSLPLTTALVRLQATDGMDNTPNKIVIQVRNVNRAPEFTSFPDDTVYCRMADTLKTAAITFRDPDADDVSISLQSAPQGMEIEPGGGISWYIPRTGYTPGRKIPVTVRITDGDKSIDRLLYVGIDPHQWELMNQWDIGHTTVHMTASGKDTIFYGISGPDAKIYRSTDCGRSWPSGEYVNHSDISNGRFTYLKARGRNIYAGIDVSFANSLGSRYSVFSFDSPVPTVTRIPGTLSAFDVSPDESRVIAQYDSLDRGSYSIKNCLYYKDENISGRKDLISDSIDNLACGTVYTWANNGDYIWLMEEYSTSSDTLGFRYFYPISDGVSGVVCDGNDGDTAFVVTNSNAIYRLSARSLGGDKINLDAAIIPAGICALSGKLGWMWDTEGNVYFTNDSFNSITKESLINDIGEEVRIMNMFKSSDNETVFAYALDGNGNMTLFRY